MKLHRTYPIWLHLLHIIYHGGMFTFQFVGFVSSLQSSGINNLTPEPAGPGWHFRHMTTWILTNLTLYMLAAFLFDIILIFKGINNIIIKLSKIHLDRFFCLMFSTNNGMGLFFHVLFFINCIQNKHCLNYTEPLLFIHLMPFWYSLAEHFFVPHNTRRDIKTTPILICIFCLMYFINYWLFVAQTHGHYPYGDPWPLWQWIVYFCIPLTMILLRIMNIIRDRLFYKCLLRSHCVHPPQEFHANPWIGWHADYSQVDEIGIQPIDWKALGVMLVILSVVIAIWNISYLATS